MAQVTNGIRAILGNPNIYNLSQKIMGSDKGWISFVQDHIKPSPGMRILDIGCGTAAILHHLGDVDYYGYDINPDYIAHAKNIFGERGKFFCQEFTSKDLAHIGSFDVVTLCGVLHHLDDGIAINLIELLSNCLKKEGKVVTSDGCYVHGQSYFAKTLLDFDRGKNVRSENGYLELFKKSFQTVESTIVHKKWIPYTCCFVTAKNPSSP
jgi:SAM-dependent methyltransferase